MLSRSLRPLTAGATSLAANPIRSNRLPGPFCIRTLANIPNVTISEPATIPTPSETNPPRQLPYFVGRNNLNNFSVYHKTLRGGNYKITLLKRGEGHLSALKQDLIAALQLPDDEVSIKSVTNHLVIKGHKREKVVHFLRTMGF
ncbi:mitochondrial large subunit ribosomal protein-domain-containing protein [Xylaria digitata]|nr:mitochondrial large subunit ribosomal protein-domain-containing protein [Xylaria digitata]